MLLLRTGRCWAGWLATAVPLLPGCPTLSAVDEPPAPPLVDELQELFPEAVSLIEWAETLREWGAAPEQVGALPPVARHASSAALDACGHERDLEAPERGARGGGTCGQARLESAFLLPPMQRLALYFRRLPSVSPQAPAMLLSCPPSHVSYDGRSPQSGPHDPPTPPRCAAFWTDGHTAPSRRGGAWHPRSAPTPVHLPAVCCPQNPDSDARLVTVVPHTGGWEVRPPCVAGWPPAAQHPDVPTLLP